MQRPSEIKRRKISDTAARLFATKPFHKVRLDDVAAAAQVGKGTLYIYFKSKEDLYVSLVGEGFSQLVESMRASSAAPPPRALAEIVRQLVAFAFAHPNFFELMRTIPQLANNSGLQRMRKQLSDLITRTLRRGIRAGIWSRPAPRINGHLHPRHAPQRHALRPIQSRRRSPLTTDSPPRLRRHRQGDKMSKHFLFSCILLLTAGGCHLNQKEEVARYRKVLDADAPPINFTPGQPLSLEQALALANAHNERLSLRGEDYLQALIFKDRAASNFMPTISLAPSYFWQDPVAGTEQNAGAGGGTTSSLNHRYDLPVTARMNLFNGLSDVANYRAAGRTIEQRRALLLDAQAVVLLDVARTYYQVLRSERSVDVLKNSLNLQETRVREFEARRRAGVVRPLDVAQTEAQLSSTKVTLIDARSDVINARTTLAFLVGAPVDQSPLLDQAALTQAVPALDTLEEMAFNHRQDLLAARAGTEAAKYDVQAAIGRYFPSVSLNFNYFLHRETLPNESDWNGLLVANLPIFTGGLLEADLRLAWSLLRQAKLSESLTERQVLQDVRIAYENMLSSQDRLKELQVQLKAADEALLQADQSYKAGLGTNLERLVAQDRLLSTQLQLTSERYDQKIFYLALLRAVGRLSIRLPGEPTPATLPATMPSTRPTSQISDVGSASADRSSPSTQPISLK
jgi:outer membrane protein TolC/AcrR family transcriptional regulator